MKLGGIAAGRLCMGTWSLLSTWGMKKTTMDTEISTQQLCKECLILAKGKSSKFKPTVLQDTGDSADVIWAEPMAVRPYGTPWNRYFLKGYRN